VVPGVSVATLFRDLASRLTNRSSRAHTPWVILQVDGRLLIYQVLDRTQGDAVQAERLLHLAQELVDETPDFFVVKGAGPGDLATNAFMAELRSRARVEFEYDFAEQEISGSNGFRVDYYFPDEATVVEIALGLPKPKTEYERDVLKVVMALEAGVRVTRLFFISKPGACKKCAQPARTGVASWLRANHDVTIEVHELERRSV